MKIFEFTFEELDIKAEDIEILMGFEPNESPYPFPEWLKDELEGAPSLCNIKGGFDIFDDISVNQDDHLLRIKNQIFHPGKIAINLLKESTSAALFVCTAGHDISDPKKLKDGENEEFRLYIRDLIGTVTVEKAVELIRGKIESEAKVKGLNISTSFSPGYCEWSVAEQHKLFSLLPENFCGIKLSSSSLMSPVKSVSGITGIGANCKKQYNQCYWCKDKNCIYGKIRRKKIV
jgi:hypothetical protein